MVFQMVGYGFPNFSGWNQHFPWFSRGYLSLPEATPANSWSKCCSSRYLDVECGLQWHCGGGGSDARSVGFKLFSHDLNWFKACEFNSGLKSNGHWLLKWSIYGYSKPRFWPNDETYHLFVYHRVGKSLVSHHSFVCSFINLWFKRRSVIVWLHRIVIGLWGVNQLVRRLGADMGNSVAL